MATLDGKDVIGMAVMATLIEIRSLEVSGSAFRAPPGHATAVSSGFLT